MGKYVGMFLFGKVGVVIVVYCVGGWCGDYWVYVGKLYLIVESFFFGGENFGSCFSGCVLMLCLWK